LKPWLADLWLFFDQAFFLDHKPPLSIFLLWAKTGGLQVLQPVDKSVVKLWKDSAEGRRCWLGAIVPGYGQSCKMPWGYTADLRGSSKKLSVLLAKPYTQRLAAFALAPKDCGPACG
jgi:hypothetical protein